MFPDNCAVGRKNKIDTDNGAMVNQVKVTSYAKLNLSLEITGEKGGYHLLDSFVCSVDLGDAIRLKKRRDRLVNVVMRGQGSEGIPPEENVAVRAAEAFTEKYGVNGADITVLKDIPMGAGLGGSSADAAGVLNGMAKLYGIDDYEGIKSIADSLGSDTGYMLRGGFARMTGRGEQVWRLETPRESLYFLLLCPHSSVSTGKCYSLFDELGCRNERGRTEECIQSFLSGRYSDMGRLFHNALYPPACALNADVAMAYEALEAFSPLGVCMSGSGSSVFALFENRELCEWARSRYRGRARAYVVKTVDPLKLQNGKSAFRNPFFLTKEETGGGI